MAWSALTHRMHDEWKEQNLRGRSILVLFSGGGDSTALLSVVKALSAPLGFRLAAGHLHHGPGANQPYRDEALAFCRDFCAALEIPFLSEMSPRELKSEADLREFRRARALEWANERGFDRLVVAHHEQDLLETRFFRLMRGTGAKGLIAMRPWAAPWWRPFLAVSKSEIRAHLSWEKLDFLEDPSNSGTGPMRNWLRQDLFPRLEKKRAGSLHRLARSLESILEEMGPSTLAEESMRGDGLSRAWLLTLSASQQKRALAQYLWSLGQRSFRHTQLEEICKRLDISQSEHRFSLAGCDWVLNAEQVRAIPRGKSL